VKLTDKVCIVTDSSRGLGKAIAVAYAEAGAKAVAITYTASSEGAEETASLVTAAGSEALVHRLEVTDRASIKACLEAVGESVGSIDVLVNIAGINKQGFMPDVTEADWDEIMNVNLKGPFLCSQEVFPMMERQNGGRIINIASVSGLYGGPKTIHYAVSKAGLISMTQVLARHGDEHNILVNAIAPGIVETDLTREELQLGGGGVVVEMTLLKRPGQVEDVSSAALFLASDSQSYMIAQTISPNGGSRFTN
jgi:3-oxoacyl-[acyl-carrier protein] reductase